MSSDYKVQNNMETTKPKLVRFRESIDNELGINKEDFLENINSTPIGKLLQIISSLPEIRQEKVFHAREQISQGQYDFDDSLDAALDRVLEELIAD